MILQKWLQVHFVGDDLAATSARQVIGMLLMVNT